MSIIMTHQTRIADQPGTAGLEAFASLQGTMARKLNAAMSAGRKWGGDLQTTFYQRFGVDSVHLAHVHKQVKAKRDAATEGAKVDVATQAIKADAKARQIAGKEKSLKAANEVVSESPGKVKRLEARLAKAKPDKVEAIAGKLAAERAKLDGAIADRKRLKQELHRHERRLGVIEDRGKRAEHRASVPTVCFGTRKLFAAQHHLRANGYRDHASWKADWVAARDSQVYVEGSKRETNGNEMVKASVAEDGSLTVELRLPQALDAHADRRWTAGGSDLRSLTLTGLRFGRAHAAVRAALLAGGQPITWRFVRDRTSWRAYVTLRETVPIAARWSRLRGVIGVDLNADHVAATHADRHGNPIRTWRFPLHLYRKSTEQRLDAIRKVAKLIAVLAAALDVPVAAEALDFADKRAQLGAGQNPRHALMLSSFAYEAFADALDRACARAGVALRRVNAAYTSLQGDVRFARPLGLSVHHAAALVIARRSMHLSEAPPDVVEVSLGTRGRVTLDPPARMGRRHVWSWWRQVASRRKRARETRPLADGVPHPPDPRRRGTGDPPGRPASAGPEGLRCETGPMHSRDGSARDGTCLARA